LAHTKNIVMKNFLLTGTLAIVLFGFKSMEHSDKSVDKGFIEIVVQNHLVSHGFDENNKEIIEEVVVDQPSKKFISVDRIQSISEKYILTTYSFDRLVYWEYQGSYEALKEKVIQANGR